MCLTPQQAYNNACTFHSSEPCQRQDCVKLRKEMRQNEMRQMGYVCSTTKREHLTRELPSILRDPGKDLDKQRVVEHDQLIHEFERLTTDPDPTAETM